MKTKTPRHYSYRMDHDVGFAPHIWRNIASVFGCKTTTIERWAVEGSWIVGIGGKGTGQPDKLLYAMKVTETPTCLEFRKSTPGAAAYLANRDDDEARVLVSRNEFYYFGDHALAIPARLRHIIPLNQGCKRLSDQDIKLLKQMVLDEIQKGKHGKPCNGPAGSC